MITYIFFSHYQDFINPGKKFNIFLFSQILKKFMISQVDWGGGLLFKQ